MPNQDVRIAPAEGKLGVLIPGMGAVTTTFIAGLEALKRGLGKPIGSLTQLGTVRLGKRTEGRSPAIRDFVPLANVEDLEIATWDIFEDNAYEAAVKAGVLEMPLLQAVKEPLEAIEPMQAVFDQKFVKRLNGPNVKAGGTKMDYAEAVMDDIRKFQQRTKVARTVMIWCGSTEVYHEAAEVHSSLERFERGLRENDPEISPSQIYAYAALKMGVPYANGAPHMTTDMPALLETEATDVTERSNRRRRRPLLSSCSATRTCSATWRRPRRAPCWRTGNATNRPRNSARTCSRESRPAMPALARAAKAERKLASVELGWPTTGLDAGAFVGALAGMLVLTDPDVGVDRDTAEAVGSLLLEEARLVVHWGEDPESLVRQALDRLGARLAAAESAARDFGADLGSLDPAVRRRVVARWANAEP